MSKYVTKTLGAVVAVVLLVVLALTAATSSPEPATAGAGCVVDVSGTIGVVICAGKAVARVPLPTVTVEGPTITLPPVTVPGPTINVPGPVKTVTVAPGQETVTVPGPTETITVRVPNETLTVTTKPKPSQTVTEKSTSSATPGGQPTPSDGRVDPAPDEDSPSVDLGDGKVTVTEVGLGVLGVLALLAVILFGMYLGWRIGRKGSRDEDTAFMRSLLDSAKVRR